MQHEEATPSPEYPSTLRSATPSGWRMPGSSRRQATRVAATTTRGPRRSTAGTRPRPFSSKGPERRARPSSRSPSVDLVVQPLPPALAHRPHPTGQTRDEILAGAYQSRPAALTHTNWPPRMARRFEDVRCAKWFRPDFAQAGNRTADNMTPQSLAARRRNQERVFEAMLP
jgi:hypothetical protein